MNITLEKVDGANALTSADLAEITSLPKAIMDAWRDHDAQAFANLFDPNGTMILPGYSISGSQNIAEFMQAAFTGPYRGTQVVGSPVRVTALGDDSAIMLTEGGVIPSGHSELPGNAKVFASWTVIRTQSGWRLASYQNTPQAKAAA